MSAADVAVRACALIDSLSDGFGRRIYAVTPAATRPSTATPAATPQIIGTRFEFIVEGSTSALATTDVLPCEGPGLTKLCIAPSLSDGGATDVISWLGDAGSFESPCNVEGAMYGAETSVDLGDAGGRLVDESSFVCPGALWGAPPDEPVDGEVG